eukprot:scaffold7074_cov85-Skeletonema_dohrnii-CCMP3373.AAC.1
MVVVDRRGIHVTYWAEMRQTLRALGAGRERCTRMVSLPRDSLLKSKTRTDQTKEALSRKEKNNLCVPGFGSSSQRRSSDYGCFSVYAFRVLRKKLKIKGSSPQPERYGLW